MAHDYDEGIRGRRSWDAEDDFDDAPFGRYPHELPHSGLGIASFILGLAAIGLVGILVVVAITEANRPHYPNDPLDTFAGLMVCGAGLLALVGGGLGIGGVCQSNRRKVFGIVGLCLNGTLLLGTLLLMLIGLVAYNAMR
jgi:hypothetical protein